MEEDEFFGLTEKKFNFFNLNPNDVVFSFFFKKKNLTSNSNQTKITCGITLCMSAWSFNGP